MNRLDALSGRVNTLGVVSEQMRAALNGQKCRFPGKNEHKYEPIQERHKTLTFRQAEKRLFPSCTCPGELSGPCYGRRVRSRVPCIPLTILLRETDPSSPTALLSSRRGS